MENKFKAGDKVRCVQEDSGGYVFGKIGEIFEVKEGHNGCFLDSRGYAMSNTRFELVEEKLSSIEKPSHYNQGKIEVIDFILDQQLDFPRGNIVKYVCRAKHKGNELEDLKKAREYLDIAIKELENHSDKT